MLVTKNTEKILLEVSISNGELKIDLTGYSIQALLVNVTWLTFYILFWSHRTGCIVLSFGQEKFNGEAIDTLHYVVNQSNYTVHTLRNVTEYLSLAKSIKVAEMFLPSDIMEDIDNLNVDLNTAADTLSNHTNENSVKIRKVFNAVYVFINFKLFSYQYMQFNIDIHMVNWFILQASCFDYNGSNDVTTGSNWVKYVLLMITSSKFWANFVPRFLLMIYFYVFFSPVYPWISTCYPGVSCDYYLCLLMFLSQGSFLYFNISMQICYQWMVIGCNHIHSLWSVLNP